MAVYISFIAPQALAEITKTKTIALYDQTNQHFSKKLTLKILNGENKGKSYQLKPIVADNNLNTGSLVSVRFISFLPNKLILTTDIMSKTLSVLMIALNLIWRLNAIPNTLK